ncbi:Alpha/beta hydrolase fold-1 [Dactylonectria macrodidyma]|uniref:Alpha/beta hydrolase fold-1 n=1 Tax=Dactylonectria macrodidyma TaxID=307937 RepID=A0A9P9INS4_9HYPO|nr:Alpha/beta hydrolase fold-1 [Dactylonectria macrodidyma]
MSSNPTLVFVPGAWHLPETWDRVTSVIETQHYKCVSVGLPTTISVSSNFSDDVNAVKDAIRAETTEGRDVVVVVHSYGGAVGASALKGFTPPQDGSASSGTGQVIGYILVASGFMVTGVTFLHNSGGKPPPFWKEDPETGLAILLVDTRELFYHDLPEEEGNAWVAKLQKQSMKAFTEGAEDAYAGWKEVPVWFVATVEDKALPFEVQKGFVQKAKDEGGDVTLREIETSHSPMLSKPQETADVILEAVAAFKKQK